MPTGAQHQVVYRPFWEALPDDLKDIVKYAMQATEELFLFQGMMLDWEGLKNFMDYGVEVLPLPQSIADAFSAEAKLFYAERALEDPTGVFTELMDAQLEFMEICKWQGVS